MWGKIVPSRRRRQRRIGREIAIGIDAGGLNPAIPDIAIDVTGQQRIEQQHIGPQTDRNAKDRARARAWSEHARPGLSLRSSADPRGWSVP